MRAQCHRLIREVEEFTPPASVAVAASIGGSNWAPPVSMFEPDTPEHNGWARDRSTPRAAKYKIGATPHQQAAPAVAVSCNVGRFGAVCSASGASSINPGKSKLNGRVK